MDYFPRVLDYRDKDGKQVKDVGKVIRVISDSLAAV
jgi:hypothetical protein